MELKNEQQTQPLIILSEECGFASSIVGEQKIRTINISKWEVEKAAIIPVIQTDQPLP